MSLLYFRKPYKSDRGHIVTCFGRLLYKVTSASRKGLIHTVDLETSNGEPVKDAGYILCDCEDAKFHLSRPCRHGAAVLEALWENITKHSKVTKIPTRRTYQLDRNKKYEAA